MEATLNGMRHVAIHDPAAYADKRVALIGVGTIGSHLAQLLARMQVNITMFDHDTVEEHNLATQTYGQADIGKLKVDAVKEQLDAIHPENQHVAIGERFTAENAAEFDLIVSAVDSLRARREIAQMLVDAGVPTPIVDGRVGREQSEVYYFENAQAWLEQLPEKGDTDPCGARFTAYSGIMAGAFMANNVKRLLLGQKIHAARVIYDAASFTFIKE